MFLFDLMNSMHLIPFLVTLSLSSHVRKLPNPLTASQLTKMSGPSSIQRTEKMSCIKAWWMWIVDTFQIPTYRAHTIPALPKWMNSGRNIFWFSSSENHTIVSRHWCPDIRFNRAHIPHTFTTSHLLFYSYIPPCYSFLLCSCSCQRNRV